MEQNQNRQKLEASLAETQKNKIKSLLKTAGWAALPVVVFGGLGLFGGLVSSRFESKDLGTLVSLGVGVGGGVVIGYSGMVADYIEKFRAFVDDVRCASSRAREYRTQLQELK